MDVVLLLFVPSLSALVTLDFAFDLGINALLTCRCHAFLVDGFEGGFGVGNLRR